MTTLYNQSGVYSISVSETGHTHNRSADADDNSPTAIDCPACEPFLVKEGWVYSPDIVPLTADQLRAQERAEREGTQAVRWASEQLAMGARAALNVAREPAEPAEPAQITVMAPPLEQLRPPVKDDADLPAPTYRDLQDRARALGLPTTGKKEALVAAIAAAE